MAKRRTFRHPYRGMVEICDCRFCMQGLYDQCEDLHNPDQDQMDPGQQEDEDSDEGWLGVIGHGV